MPALIAFLLPALVSAQGVVKAQDLSVEDDRRVVTVSPRPLLPPEIDLVRKAARGERESTVPELGRFVPFTTDETRLAIWDGYLLERRYTLSEQVLRRLGDIWQPGQLVRLEGEEALRSWLSQNCPPDSTGKDSNDAPVFRLSVQPEITLAVGKERKIVQISKRESNLDAEQNWPVIKAKSPPRKGDDEYAVTIPGQWSIDPDELYDVERSSQTLALVAQTLEAWHKERNARLRKSAAAFFAKRDAALEAQFGGVLPVGRPISTLSNDIRRRLDQELSGHFRSMYGFKTSESARSWLAQAKVVKVEAALYADLPKFAGGQPYAIFFPVYLP
ncbi:hypothetical protein EON81_23700 [bacterium]|nr:MAG: hypothetical protein EON81_23700 [bacterium]